MSEDAVRASPPSSACFAIAGPVDNGIGQMTNLGWTIDGPKIQKEFGWRWVIEHRIFCMKQYPSKCNAVSRASSSIEYRT